MTFEIPKAKKRTYHNKGKLYRPYKILLEEGDFFEKLILWSIGQKRNFRGRARRSDRKVQTLGDVLLLEKIAVYLVERKTARWGKSLNISKKGIAYDIFES